MTKSEARTILGVTGIVSQEELKQAFRNQSRHLHTDRFVFGSLDWENANKMQSTLNEAYEILKTVLHEEQDREEQQRREEELRRQELEKYQQELEKRKEQALKKQKAYAKAQTNRKKLRNILLFLVSALYVLFLVLTDREFMASFNIMIMFFSSVSALMFFDTPGTLWDKIYNIILNCFGLVLVTILYLMIFKIIL